MSIKTKSEKLFESFLKVNGIRVDEIEQSETSRPDYLVYLGNKQLIFEIKEITQDPKFGVVTDPAEPHIKVNESTIGEHVRRRIGDSKPQIQYGAKRGIPSVLLVYNKLDVVFQTFGTGDLDFVTAMYGDLTINLDKNTHAASEPFYGENQQLKQDRNTSFSAVGHLCDRGGETTIKLFENVFAAVKLPFEDMPPCFQVIRIEIDDRPLSANPPA